MDLFKKTNVDMATACDYNATRYVFLSDRRKVAKMLRRYARRKLKQEIRQEIAEERLYFKMIE